MSCRKTSVHMTSPDTHMAFLHTVVFQLCTADRSLLKLRCLQQREKYFWTSKTHSTSSFFVQTHFMKPNVIYLQQLSHIRIPAVKLKYRRQKHASFLIYIKCQKKGLFTVQSFVHACVIHETRVESSHTNCSMKESGIFLGVYFSPQPILHHLYWYAYCVSIG